MKKAILVLAILLVATMALFMPTGCAACNDNGNDAPAVNQNGTPAANQNDAAPAETTQPEQSPVGNFEPNDDLAVLLAFVDGRDINVVLRNMSDAPIASFRVAYTGFDRNGLPVTRNGHGTVNRDIANLMPGETTSMRISARGGEQYVIATAARVEFVGGDTWVADDLGGWAEGVISVFEPEMIAAQIEALGPAAVNAPENDYIEIVRTSRTRNNIEITVRNTTDRTIREARFMILQFDQNGYPINVTLNNYVQNARRFLSTLNLTAGSTVARSITNGVMPSAEHYYMLVWDVEFADGDTWSNPYAYAWLVYNADSYRG